MSNPEDIYYTGIDRKKGKFFVEVTTDSARGFNSEKLKEVILFMAGCIHCQFYKNFNTPSQPFLKNKHSVKLHERRPGHRTAGGVISCLGLATHPEVAECLHAPSTGSLHNPDK